MLQVDMTGFIVWLKNMVNINTGERKQAFKEVLKQFMLINKGLK